VRARTGLKPPHGFVQRLPSGRSVVRPDHWVSRPTRSEARGQDLSIFPSDFFHEKPEERTRGGACQRMAPRLRVLRQKFARKFC
jgi:hypothetical protein